MKRLKREHGRIMSVETKVRGDSLAEDAAAGATTLTVGDAADFDEDGGWLVVNDQVIEYLETDDDEGTITLATGLSDAADEGDAVHVWSTLYDETVDYQEALVELDGEYDNPEPVVAEVAEGVGDLPEGDRGVAGESCTLLRVSDDEWEVVGVGGRARKSRSIRFEDDDSHTLTADDITAGTVTLSLSHRPINESLTCVLAGVPQPPTEWTIDYDDDSLTIPLSGWEKAGNVLWVHYAYRKGLRGFLLDFRRPSWRYKIIALSDATDYSGTAVDDSTWSVGTAPFGDDRGIIGWDPIGTSWPSVSGGSRCWIRRTVEPPAGRALSGLLRCDDGGTVYWNGEEILDVFNSAGEYEFSIPAAKVLASNVLAVRGQDESTTNPLDNSYVDVKLWGN